MSAAYETLSETEWERVNRVWELLDNGEVERARLELGDLLKRPPGHPDVRIVDAPVSLDEGEPRRALKTLDGAERSADPSLFFHLRAMAEYELAQFARARDDAQRALAVHADLAEAHDLIARASEHLGEWEDATAHAEEARAIDPEAFPPPLEVSEQEFDA